MSDASVRALDARHLSLLHHLASPTLPIGGFTYSQGLEAAVELKLIRNEADTATWIGAQLHGVMAQAEAPLWCLLFDAWAALELSAPDTSVLDLWNQWFHATRETLELRQETEQMGTALARLAQELGWGSPAQRQILQALRPPSLPLAHSFICACEGLPLEAGLSAYLFTWLENQVAAAVKSVPLGQLAGQRILQGLRQELSGVIAEALRRSQAIPPDLQTLAPQYSIVSSRHESQFSRLFRS